MQSIFDTCDESFLHFIFITSVYKSKKIIILRVLVELAELLYKAERFVNETVYLYIKYYFIFTGKNIENYNNEQEVIYSFC